RDAVGPRLGDLPAAEAAATAPAAAPATTAPARARAAAAGHHRRVRGHESQVPHVAVDALRRVDLIGEPARAVERADLDGHGTGRLVARIEVDGRRVGQL